MEKFFKSLPVQIATGIILTGIIYGIVMWLGAGIKQWHDNVMLEQERRIKMKHLEDQRRKQEHIDSIYRTMGVVTKQEFDSIAAESSNSALDWKDYHDIVFAQYLENAISSEEYDKHQKEYYKHYWDYLNERR